LREKWFAFGDKRYVEHVKDQLSLAEIEIQ